MKMIHCFPLRQIWTEGEGVEKLIQCKFKANTFRRRHALMVQSSPRIQSITSKRKKKAQIKSTPCFCLILKCIQCCLSEMHTTNCPNWSYVPKVHEADVAFCACSIFQCWLWLLPPFYLLLNLHNKETRAAKEMCPLKILYYPDNVLSVNDMSYICQITSIIFQIKRVTNTVHDRHNRHHLTQMIITTHFTVLRANCQKAVRIEYIQYKHVL